MKIIEAPYSSQIYNEALTYINSPKRFNSPTPYEDLRINCLTPKRLMKSNSSDHKLISSPKPPLPMMLSQRRKWNCNNNHEEENNNEYRKFELEPIEVVGRSRSNSTEDESSHFQHFSSSANNQTKGNLVPRFSSLSINSYNCESKCSSPAMKILSKGLGNKSGGSSPEIKKRGNKRLTVGSTSPPLNKMRDYSKLAHLSLNGSSTPPALKLKAIKNEKINILNCINDKVNVPREENSYNSVEIIKEVLPLQCNSNPFSSKSLNLTKIDDLAKEKSNSPQKPEVGLDYGDCVYEFPLWKRDGSAKNDDNYININNGRKYSDDEKRKREKNKFKELKVKTSLTNIDVSKKDSSKRKSAKKENMSKFSTEEDVPFSWKIGEEIGKGTFGRVFLALNESTGELLAVKTINIDNCCEYESDEYEEDEGNNVIKDLEKEILLMKELDNRHIVSYLFTRRDDEYLYIFMEYVPGGNVSSMLKQFGAFSEEIVKRFTRQICIGLNYLHTKGIAHRDIKGGNVLLNETGLAKLSDFGCSKQLQGMRTTSLDESLQAIKGSVPWMAPEVIRQAGHGRKADIWSLGCTVIEMLTGKHPWPEFENNVTAMFHIATAKTSPPLPEGLNISRECVDFLEKCLQIDPMERWTAQQLLEHSFLTLKCTCGCE